MMSVQLLGQTLGLLFVVYCIHRIIYNIAVSPLSRFPGPKLWAISQIPSQLSVLRGRNHLDITRLHEQYGSVVRTGPNELTFNSPQAFRDIYGARPGQDSLPKDRTHYTPPPNGVDHVVSAVDTATHTRQRKLLSYAFSTRAINEQESVIRQYVDVLIWKLREQVKGGSDDRKAVVDIKSWMNYTTFDITGDLMFGESFDCLKQGKLHPWIGLIFDSIKGLVFLGAVNQFPLLSSVLQKMIPRSVLQKGLDHFDLGVRKVDRRLQLGAARPDFISAMLRNGLGEREGKYEENNKIMSRAELHSNAFILIIAGSETSATLISGCLFYLCKSPTVKHKLLREIRSTFSTAEEITFSKIAKLEYLSAVIEESLRVYPPFATSLAREVPPGGASVAGDWIPEKTIIACHHYASYHSTSNFEQPDLFIPERWLDDSRFAFDKKDTLQPFSLGPRDCLGKQLAYAEIRLILCTLLFSFDIELSPESTGWIDHNVYFLWDKPPLMVVLTERARTRGSIIKK